MHRRSNAGRALVEDTKMLDREQIVTEIAQEVLARLSQQRVAARPAPRPVAPRPPAITIGDGVFRTVDELLAHCRSCGYVPEERLNV